MLDLLSSVKGLLKVDRIRVDNNVFRLHYKVTVIILVAFSILVTSKQYIGDPIDCIVDDGKVSSDVMDTYCWIHSTFTIPKHFHKPQGSVIAPGVGPYVKDQDEVKYHQYYQWVCFVLFFQAIQFYMPRYIWKVFEGGKMKNLVSDLNTPLIEKDKKQEMMEMLVDYLVNNKGNHNMYAVAYFLCEGLNFVNVCWQMYFMDLFLDGEFTKYGREVIYFAQMDETTRSDPMVIVFPRMTKCTFYTYGSSGTIQSHDGQCVLPLNIVNEKIFIFLWFWFIMLAVVTGIALLYRFFIICSVTLRTYILRYRASSQQMDFICANLQIGDWFVLYLLSKNLNPLIYGEFVNNLYEELPKDMN